MAKLSEIDLENVKQAARIDYDSDDVLLGHIMDAAKGYIRTYTGLEDADLDDIPEMVIAFYCLCSDMYDVREMTVQNVKPNPTVEQILGSHAVNYV